MTAKDLLYKVLDYRHSWMSDMRINEKPAELRRLQIETLQKAFNLSKDFVIPNQKIRYLNSVHNGSIDREKYLTAISNLDYLLTGEFLNDRKYENNKVIIDQFLQCKEQNYAYFSSYLNLKQIDLVWMFSDLFFFRQDLYKITCVNDDFFENYSFASLYSRNIKFKFEEIVNLNIDEIDDTLWLLLDPEKRIIAEEDLIRLYGYPCDDLRALDLDWKFENY